MFPRVLPALIASAALTGAVAPASAAVPRPASLEARAILPADASAPAPFPGVVDSDPAPAADARQPIGGFSALLDAPGRDVFWAMPDNGFGTKANSRSFLLRVYRIRARFETRSGGEGAVDVLDSITLRDPDRHVPFGIVNQRTTERLLTGGDFDIESVRIDRRGHFWFGEEFGPFLLHTDASGRVLEAPIPLPDVKSPDHPADAPAPFEGDANLGRSNGFEGMALSDDGRRLYPVLEGAVTGDDPRARRIYEFDIRRSRYTGRELEYRVDDPSFLVSDLTALDRDRFIALERDNREGATARHKQGFAVDFDRRRPDGTLLRRRVVDLLDIADPRGISLPARPGDVGLGNPFAMPYVTIESVLPLGPDRLAIVNDTNFGSLGRNPQLPDYSDLVVLRVPALRDALVERARTRDGGTTPAFTATRPSRSALAVIGDTPYGDDQVAAFPGLVADIDADRQVGLVLHVGDVKNGSSTCSDQRLRSVRALYDSFADPFVYTPGDNEWTDCHRPAAGGYLPTERLASVRDLFFAESGETLGRRALRPIRQSDEAGFEDFVENQLWGRSDAIFSTLHVVGSNNGLEPWFAGAETESQRAIRLQEFEERMEANLAWLDTTFAQAERREARGVVIAMQADMFAAGPVDGFTPIVRRIAELASRFDGPVLLLEGDTHRYLVDQPLLTGSAAHGVETAAPNVTRIVVEGETAGEWLKLSVRPRATPMFRWTRERV
ncbi:MAG: Putative transmembrane protein [uncultured Solirubrobacteraceae bacterium]|uniref:Transmembrane protein n=1 Tax=uncultured Solirubrobacteraceae bacterium TaxID=1162706 RepID=A0A6J4S411_9ACTN|nr:MAG: Putative transmembrane protein [uncultured Solirubrobacteraceae bacterium]